LFAYIALARWLLRFQPATYQVAEYLCQLLLDGAVVVSLELWHGREAVDPAPLVRR